MMWFKIAVVALLLIIFLWGAYKGNLYRKIFADWHYIEIAEGLRRVKLGAIERMDAEIPEGPEARNDPRALVTRAGLAIFYTINRRDSRYEHHYSVSLVRRYTPGAVGRSFVMYIALLLGIDPKGINIAVSELTVHHAAFALDETEEAVFETYEIPVPKPEEVRVYIQESMRLRAESLRADGEPEGSHTE